MASPAMAKLKALMTKNFLEMKRNIASTICEIFFPIIIISLFLVIRNFMGIDTHKFKEEDGVENYIFNRSTSNINFTYLISQSRHYNKINKTDNKWNDLQILPPLNICTWHNAKGHGRPRIAAVNVPEKIKKKIQSDYKFFDYPFDINENISDFNSTEDFKNYMKEVSYGETKENPEICFGIVFDSSNPFGFLILSKSIILV